MYATQQKITKYSVQLFSGEREAKVQLNNFHAIGKAKMKSGKAVYETNTNYIIYIYITVYTYGVVCFKVKAR